VRIDGAGRRTDVASSNVKSQCAFRRGELATAARPFGHQLRCSESENLVRKREIIRFIQVSLAEPESDCFHGNGVKPFKHDRLAAYLHLEDDSFRGANLRNWHSSTSPRSAPKRTGIVPWELRPIEQRPCNGRLLLGGPVVSSKNGFGKSFRRPRLRLLRPLRPRRQWRSRTSRTPG
jgi:hypothetical protein